MQRYSDNVIGRNGSVIEGATVTVRDADGNLATLYSDDGVTSQANPMTTDSDGEFAFYAGDGTYTITVTGRRIGSGNSKIVTLISEASVASYAALRSFAGTSKTVNVTGYLASANPSGIAGIFTRDDSDTTSADNGGTIIVASNGKRWKRVIEGPINVRWFGAKGDWDGSTGTDDTAAFVALRSFCRTNGQKAYTPAGRYRLTESLALGTDAGGFPYSGFDFEGDGAECTELVLDYDGANGLDINPGTGGYTAFANASIGGFRITVPTGRTVNVPLYVKNCYNDRFHDIHIYVPASCADGNFIGMRVSGACYFNKFENIWIENHTGTANAGSRAFYTGNGLADVGVSGANTSVNTFLNCRAYGFGVNWDTIYANSTTFINCDSETGITRNWRDLSTIGSQYINCWEEGGPATSATIDRSLAVFQADGSTITGAASDQVLIRGGLWDDIEVDYAYHVRIVAAYNNLTTTANSEDVQGDNLKDSGTLTGAGNDVRVQQRKTSPVIRNVLNIGSRRVGWQFGATAGPAELLLNYSGDDISINAYRDAGSSTYRGWKQATDGTGAWVLSSWFTAAGIGSESPVDLIKANISGVFAQVGLMPLTDNAIKLGESANRWSQLYAGTATINTSDAREKEQVRPLSEAEHAVAVRLKSMVRAFKFKDAVRDKGDGARIHFGVIAQEVKAAFEAEGLVAEDYALLCYDEWEDRYEPVMEEILIPAVDRDGKPVCDAEGKQYILREQRPTGEQRLVMPAGNRYGVRYEELLAFIIAAL